MHYSEFTKKYGIGLTGGIATGKSTVAKILTDFGFLVFDADRLSRKVMEPGTAGLAQVVQNFGALILKEDGSLDRAKMGQMIFNDPVKRKRLEEIIHPLIHELLDKELKIKGLIEKPRFWFYEASLIFETGTSAKFRQIWVTYCPEKVQLKRVQSRRNYTPELARKIIASQMPGKQKSELADFVINTDSPIEELSEKVKAALASLESSY